MSPPDILHNNEPRRRSTRPSGLLRILGVGRWATRKAEAQAEMERLLADGLRSSSPAIEPQEPTPEVSTPSYADEINKRLDAIRRAQKTYLRDALVQGTEQDNLPAMVATAMNSGMLPRIAEGIEAPRGPYVNLHTLDGEVSAAALHVTADWNPSSQDLMRCRITLDEFYPYEQSPPGTFVVTDLGVLPVVDKTVLDRSQPVDYDVLAKIDEHLSLQNPHS